MKTQANLLNIRLAELLKFHLPKTAKSQVGAASLPASLDPDEKMEQQLKQTFMSLNPVELLSNIEALQLQLDATTKEMLNIPESTEVHEFVKLLARANTGVTNEKIKRPNVVKTGRKSIVSDEVARVISFLMHQAPSLAAMGLLPLLNQRYPGM